MMTTINIVHLQFVRSAWSTLQVFIKISGHSVIMDSMNRLSNMVAMLTNKVSQQQGMAAGNGGNSGGNGGGADAAVGNVYSEYIFATN